MLHMSCSACCKNHFHMRGLAQAQLIHGRIRGMEAIYA